MAFRDSLCWSLLDLTEFDRRERALAVRLNKFQLAWIKKLKSGTTRKAKGELIKNGGSMCCLGVAIKTMQPLSLKLCENAHVTSLDKMFFPDVYKNLSLRDAQGGFEEDIVKPKWIRIIDEATVPNHVGVMARPRSLAQLNDNTSLTHVQIGEFIDQNREAVFMEVV